MSAFFALLVGLPLIGNVVRASSLDQFDAFYRSGALVFGGGHVVLPLLREAFVAPGWVSDEAFLAGYGAAQAVPGPLFTFAAYLGAVAEPAQRLAGAALGLIGIFLPDFWCCWEHCPGGANCGSALKPKPRCVESTPLSSDCWALLSTIRCGSHRSRLRRISQSP